jgi:hypothetical protein
MLSGTGFGDNPGFFHTLDKQALAHDIVGLMGTSMIEVFALYKDLGAAKQA